MGAGGEGAEPVDVHLDASTDDSGDEPRDVGLLPECRGRGELGGPDASRMTSQDDEATPRAVVVDEADEVRSDLEDDGGRIRRGRGAGGAAWASP